jgi:hypothetical protein
MPLLYNFNINTVDDILRVLTENLQKRRAHLQNLCLG